MISSVEYSKWKSYRSMQIENAKNGINMQEQVPTSTAQSQSTLGGSPSQRKTQVCASTLMSRPSSKSEQIRIATKWLS